MRFAIIDADNRVVNVIIWEGAEFLPPAGHKVVQSNVCDINDLYNEEDNMFYKDDRDA